MKVIIAGSRTITDYQVVEEAIKESGFNIVEVVSGKAKGIDRLGELYAELNDLYIKPFWADWHRYGKAAGPIRNKNMADYADGLIAIWDGQSRGTKNMIDIARSKGLKIYVKDLGKSA